MALQAGPTCQQAHRPAQPAILTRGAFCCFERQLALPQDMGCERRASHGNRKTVWLQLSPASMIAPSTWTSLTMKPVSSSLRGRMSGGEHPLPFLLRVDVIEEVFVL